MSKKAAYHHGDLRQALIESALELIAENDIQGLSLREVARRAGVSHAAPYRHFADKEALLAVVAEEGFIEFSRYLQEAVDLLPDDPLKQLEATGIAYVRYALDHATYYRVMFGYYCLDNVAFPSLTIAASQSFLILVQIITQGQAMGKMRAGDPRQLAIGAWSMVHGLATLLLAGQIGKQTVDELTALTTGSVRLIIEGIAQR